MPVSNFDYKILIQAPLTTSIATVGGAPGAGKSWIGSKMFLANTTASPVMVTLYAKPGGGTATAANMILPPVSVPANMAIEVPAVTLGPTDILAARADTGGSAVILTMFGAEGT